MPGFAGFFEGGERKVVKQHLGYAAAPRDNGPIYQIKRSKYYAVPRLRLGAFFIIISFVLCVMFVHVYFDIPQLRRCIAGR